MKVLIAEDDATSRMMLKAILTKWGYEVVETSDGDEAWQVLQREDAPRLAILDWVMPGISGDELCRKVRQLSPLRPIYIILLTVRRDMADVIAGLEAGANDYVRKPFDREELRARVRVGERVVRLEATLFKRIRELQDAMAHIKRLQGILPICTYCHRIRTDKQSWERLEEYISQHSDAEFSHGICPECLEKHLPEIKRARTDS
jgi:sigma-B regulation protein RsbU (phosphoserine phosphatase)